jgi:hypothetical protein
MITSGWFDGLSVLGKLPPAQAAAKLREVGEDEAANALEAAQSEEHPTFGIRDVFRFWPPDRVCQHTAHAFGYLAPAPLGSEPMPIQHAGNMSADPTLRNSRIKVTLDGLGAADYPGKGTHRVLFDFYAQNQLPGNVEEVHFNSTFRVYEGQRAAIIGYPIFLGLNVGSEGIAFRCFSVNVKNDDDEKFLGFLESDVFSKGLKLATSLQPAIQPLSQIAFGLTRSIAQRHRNVPVQDFYMGFDFSIIPTRARLAEGSYIAVQIPETLETVWQWGQWVYNPNNGQIVNKTDPKQLIPYNYITFSISQYEGT